jgi:hypothetical protein
MRDHRVQGELLNDHPDRGNHHLMSRLGLIYAEGTTAV